MAIAIDPNERFEFVTPADRELPADQQTSWQLRTLTVAQRAALEDKQAQGVFDESGGVAGFSFHAGTIRLEIVRAGLVGCSNFLDARGEGVPYESDKVATVLGRRSPNSPTAQFLDRVSPEDLEAIAEAIQSGARLTPAEGNG